MSMSSTAAYPRTAYRALCAALIAVQIGRVLQIAPRWSAGAPPAYPGQYERRLLNAIISVSILGAVLVGDSSARNSTRGRLAYWGLLSVAVVVLVAQVIADR